jgi:hypothetical protein
LPICLRLYLVSFMDPFRSGSSSDSFEFSSILPWIASGVSVLYFWRLLSDAFIAVMGHPNHQCTLLTAVRQRCVPERSRRRRWPDPCYARGLGAMGFASALLLRATTYSSAAYFVLNIGLIPFSPAAVYKAQLLIIPGIIAFTRKIAAENARR